MNYQDKEKIKSLVNDKVSKYSGNGASPSEVAQVQFYIASVLSGMKVQVKEGSSGKYFYASNGKQVVAMPLNNGNHRISNVSPEVIMINVKNLCVANGLDFNKYLEEYEKSKGERDPYKFLDDMQAEIVEKLGGLEYSQSIENADQLLSANSVPKREVVINSRESFDAYYKLIEGSILDGSKEIDVFKDTPWQRESTNISYLINRLMLEARKQQEEKAIQKLGNKSLEDLNDKELD